MTVAYDAKDESEQDRRVDLVRENPRAWFEALITASSGVSCEVADRAIWDALNECCLAYRGRSLDGLKHLRK